MARVHRRTPATLEPLTAHIDEETVVVTLFRPDTPALLDFTAAWSRFHRGLQAGAGAIAAAPYNELLDALLKSVQDISPLEDENGERLVYAELPREEQLGVLSCIPFADIMTIGTVLVRAGRLSAEEKKPSAPTSSTSIVAAPAAAPPAAPGEASQA